MEKPTDETDKAERGSREEGGREMNPDDIREQFKKVEVFAGGRLIREWEPVAVGDYPHFIVESKIGTLLWGHEILETIIESGESVQVERLVGADKVVAELVNGQIEVMTDDETRTFSSREGWQTYWRASDEWPEEIDDAGDATHMTDEPDKTAKPKRRAAK